jgi:hypothetical protein
MRRSRPAKLERRANDERVMLRHRKRSLYRTGKQKERERERGRRIRMSKRRSRKMMPRRVRKRKRRSWCRRRRSRVDRGVCGYGEGWVQVMVVGVFWVASDTVAQFESDVFVLVRIYPIMVVF